MKFCFAADGKRSCFARPQNCARAGGERYQLKFSRTKVYYRIKLIMHTEKSVRESLPRVGGRCSLSRIAAQSTEGLLETKKSATKSQVRDNFSAILNLMFFAVFCMAENLS